MKSYSDNIATQENLAETENTAKKRHVQIKTLLWGIGLLVVINISITTMLIAHAFNFI